MRYILAILFLLISPSVFAQTTITFAWDYDAVDVPKITGFHLFETKNPGTYTTPKLTYPNTVLTGTSSAPTGYGKWCYVLTAFITENTITTESDYSNEVCQVFKPPKPRTLTSVLKTAVTAPVKGVIKLAKLFKKDKDLKITKVS